MFNNVSMKEDALRFLRLWDLVGRAESC
jgi:hypothetical protein